MALITESLTYEQQYDKILEIISDKMKVQNPALIKTGTIGTFANILLHLQQDAKNFYSQLLRELNPALAQDTTSLMFHAALEDAKIEYASSALLDINIIVPELLLKKSELYTYTIQKGTNVIDSNGLTYTFDSDIQIYLGNKTLSAKEYSSKDGVNNLSIKRIADPKNEREFIYLVNFPKLKQYKRIFSTHQILSDAPIIINTSKNKLKEINAWLVAPDQVQDGYFYLDERNLNRLDSSNIAKYYNWEPLNIKVQKYTSSYNDNDIFLKIEDETLSLTIGDGTYGKIIPNNSRIILEIYETEGINGNINESELLIEGVISELSTNSKIIGSEITQLEAVSLNGSHGGKDFNSLEELREKVLNKRITRNTISSLKDYEIFFQMEGSTPFVSTKFFNSKTHIFIYNVLKADDKIIKTNTLNIKQDDLKVNPFYPETLYNNIDLISPFYFKQTVDGWKSFIINPRVQIKIINEELLNNKLIALNNIEAYICYDFENNETYIKLENINQDYTYVIQSNIHEMIFEQSNGFKVTVNSSYLDEFCLLIEPLNNITVNILKEDISVVSLISEGSFYQLEMIQKHFLYYNIDKYDTNNETIYVLNLPYINKEYYSTIDKIKLYEILKAYFKIKENEELFSFNTEANQLFFNTIDIQEKYLGYIVEENNNGITLTTENNILIDFVLNKQEFIQEGFKDLAEFEYIILNDIIPIYKSKEGFYTRYYETEIETYVKNKYPRLISNIKLVYPEMFIVNKNNVVHGLMEDDLIKGNINLLDIINFTPPYFYYNYDTIQLNIKFK